MQSRALAFWALLAVGLGIGALAGCNGGSSDWLTSEGTDKQVGVYQFKLPAGFEFVQTPQAIPGATNHAWQHPRSGKTPPLICVTIGPLPEGMTPMQVDWETGIERAANHTQQICSSFARGSIERLSVNGIDAARCRVRGVLSKEGTDLQALFYLLADDQNIVVLIAVAGGSDTDRQIERLDQALLTFERPGYVAPPRPATVRAEADPARTLSEARRGFVTKLRPSTFETAIMDKPPQETFRIVRYESPVGSLPAYLTPDPQDGKRHPAIVWICGGDCNTIGDVWSDAPADNDQTACAFRKAGIVMMFPSLRGGNENPGQREGFFGEVDDILTAADYLADQSYVDPNRIYLGGHSTGGTLVLLVAACSERFRAVFSFGPVDEIVKYGEEFMPFDFTSQQEMELRAPILWLHGIRSPTFVIEGSREGNAECLRAMQKATTNSKVHFCEVLGRDHFSILAPATRTIAARILADTGVDCNLALTASDLLHPPHSSFPSGGFGAASEGGAGALPDVDRMVSDVARRRELDAIRGNPSHPDYIKENVAALASNTPERRQSLERLTRLNPDDLTDQELRGQIARAMRDIAFSDASQSERRSAIEGLVVWGSTFSVPLLIKLLDDPEILVRKEVIVALGKLNDDRAIEPLAERLIAKGFMDRDIAGSLIKFGPRAENAVLKRAPTDFSLATRQVIQLLGEIGTQKSVQYFVRFRNNRAAMHMLGDEIRAARQSIDRRARDEQRAAVKATP